MKSLIFGTFFLMTLSRIYAQFDKIILWKDINGTILFVRDDTLRTNDSIVNKTKSYSLEPGIYIVYIGQANMVNYQFPSFGTSYDINYLFEDPFIELNTKPQDPLRDTLPDGKWLKIKVLSDSIVIFKEKNIRDRVLSGVWQLKRLNSKFHSYLLYDKGYVKYRKIIGDNGKTSSIGYYYDNNKIEEEKIWDINGNLWKMFKDKRVLVFLPNGKVEYTQTTDEWGNYNRK